MSDLAWLRPKLAELCGLKDIGSAYINPAEYFKKEPPDDDNPAEQWRPDEDISQAIRCLEALADKSWRWAIEKWLGAYDIQLQRPDAPHDWVREYHGDNNLKRAICLAIASALNLQPPTETP